MGNKKCLELKADQLINAIYDEHWMVRLTVALMCDINVEEYKRHFSNPTSDDTTLKKFDCKNTGGQVHKALTDKDYNIRVLAVQIATLSSEQHQRALDDCHHAVRAAAVAVGGLSPEQFEKALSDEAWSVRMAALILGNKKGDSKCVQ